MKHFFSINDYDKIFYKTRIMNFIPDRIIDIHTHIWLNKFITEKHTESSRVVQWPSLVAKENSIEDLIKTYKIIFPDKEVTPLVFSNVVSEKDLNNMNSYVKQSAKKYGFHSLIFVSPKWDADKLESEIINGNHLGIKVYLTLAPSYIPKNEIRIFDFLPHHQLDILNRHHWIVILHIPRDERLKNNVNLAQLLEIDKYYPNIKLIVAHVGRAYCNEDIGNAFEVLSETKNIMFDFSANTNSYVFTKLIKTFGPNRILFGSDLPITRMRMKRITEHGKYINLVPKGLYGDVTKDKNMREVSGKEAEKFTLFIYEQINAFRIAAEQTHLSETEIENIFYNNAVNIFETIKSKNVRQLKMVWPINKKPKQIPLPNGYLIRNYRNGDNKKYIQLMCRAGFTQWSDKNITNILQKSFPEGLFFIIHKKTGNIVATAVAQNNFSPNFSGELGWVACDPAHRGKKLGYIVCCAVLKKLIDYGYTDIYLLTDDYRLPAIKTYLNLGFKPCITEPNMKQRWETVYKNLGIKYSI